MIKNTRPSLALLLATALTLGLAACGNGTSSAQPAAQTPPGVTEPVDQIVGEVTLTPEEPGDGGGQSSEPVPVEVEPTPEDCVSYDPANLTVTASGDAWALRDGGHSMKLFDTAADAEDARRVARNWQQMCWIGRGNSGPDRYRHMVHYFREPSGLPLGEAPKTIDCITYNPDDLDIYHGPGHPANVDEDDWALFSGPTPLLFLGTEADALRARVVASQHTRLCLVGAGNDRPDPYRYRMTWWRP